MPSVYDPIRARRKYEQVIRPAKGHKPHPLLDRHERSALRILDRIDHHIAIVDAARINRYLKAKKNRTGMPRGRAPLYTAAEKSALVFMRSIRIQLAKISRKRRCKKCGNDRTLSPDVQGKCRTCFRKLKAAARKRRMDRLKASGQWQKLARAARGRRRARLAAAPINDLTPSGEALVWRTYGRLCLACGAPAHALDHIIPLARGGGHTASNLQPLCLLCNSSKGAKHSTDYRPFPYPSL